MSESAVCYTSGPVSRVLSPDPKGRRMVIYLGHRLPDTSCSQPERAVRARALRPIGEAGHLSVPIRPCTGWGLPCQLRHRSRGGLLPHRFTLARYERCSSAGGLFSVALSVGLPRLGVTQHPALWCSDFPHPSANLGARPSDPLVPLIRSRSTMLQLDRDLIFPDGNATAVFAAHHAINPASFDEELW